MGYLLPGFCRGICFGIIFVWGQLIGVLNGFLKQDLKWVFLNGDFLMEF